MPGPAQRSQNNPQMDVVYNHVPAELCELPIWLCWEHRRIEGRWTKVPLIADDSGRCAKSNDPSTWRSFEEALRFAPRADGIGLSFVAPYCGIDLDAARDPQTGALAPWARRIVDLLNSYTELSPSGNGLHIIVHLTRELPAGSRKRGKKATGEIGIYDETSPRYFTVTGVTIEHRDQIRVVAPEEFYPAFDRGELDPPAPAQQQRKHDGRGSRSKYERLLAGDWQGLYESQSEADFALVGYLAEKYGEDAAAIDKAFRASGLMREKWDEKRQGGTYGTSTIERVLRARRSSQAKGHMALYADDDLARMFSQEHGDTLRYVARWARWMSYNDTHWAEDSTLAVFDRVRLLCRGASDELISREKSSLAKQVKSAVTVANVERLARCDPRHAATIEQWDADPWLLNTPAGVVDLRSGTIRTHRREDYFTKITPVAPSGKSWLWLKFLERVTDGDRELQEFLQRMTGYALTGSTRDEALFFLYGTGANGKSKFLGAVSGMLGNYAKTAPMETFMASRGEHHPTDLAGLQGARLVTAIETESGRNWAETKVKNLTGGDRIAARFMRCDYFEFTPQFKLLIAGNHRPSLRSVDEAIRRRFFLLPFQVTIPRDERDVKLAEKLQAEWPGILAWAIEGCLAWQEQGLNPPAIVRSATAEYMEDEDTFGQWIVERCVLGNRAMGRSGELYADYCRWSEQNNEKPFSSKRFSQELKRRGYQIEHSFVGSIFWGIGLKESTS